MPKENEKVTACGLWELPWKNCFLGSGEELTLRSVLLCLASTAFLDCHQLHGTRKRELGL